MPIFQILFCSFCVAVAVWAIIAVADGVRAWRFEAVMERAEKSEARRRSMRDCRAACNAAMRESSAKKETKSAAPEYSGATVIVLVPNKRAVGGRVSLN